MIVASDIQGSKGMKDRFVIPGKLNDLLAIRTCNTKWSVYLNLHEIAFSDFCISRI